MQEVDTMSDYQYQLDQVFIETVKTNYGSFDYTNLAMTCRLYRYNFRCMNPRGDLNAAGSGWSFEHKLCRPAPQSHWLVLGTALPAAQQGRGTLRDG